MKILRNHFEVSHYIFKLIQPANSHFASKIHRGGLFDFRKKAADSSNSFVENTICNQIFI